MIFGLLWDRVTSCKHSNHITVFHFLVCSFKVFALLWWSKSFGDEIVIMFKAKNTFSL